MSMEAIRNTFFIEAREMLEQMESILLQFDNHQTDDENESLNAVFRAAHTIKGSAGIFAFHEITSFTHVVENVLDKLREKSLILTPDLISLLLRCCDHIALLLDTIEPQEDNAEIDPAIKEQGNILLASLGKLSPAEHTEIASGRQTPNSEDADSSHPLTCYIRQLTDDAAPDEEAAPPALERLDQNVSNDCWHISVRFGRDSYRNGMEPLSFLSFLNTLGKTLYITTINEDIPDTDSFDPESCYLGFEIRFESDASKQEIEDVFEFMRDDGFLHILPPHSCLKHYQELIESLPEIELRLGEILLECGALTASELEAALNKQKKQSEEKQPLGELLVNDDARLSPVLHAALSKQKNTRERISRESKTLRVDAEKLDLLINRVGELVTAGAGVMLLAEQQNESHMLEAVSLLNSLLEDVRDASLKLRMVPVGETFSKFQRVTRDTAEELGKDIELIIRGAETELDKSVVEKIADPLMHLVRNALDHGIELPQERAAKGKPEKGTLLLNARHDSGNVVIEVSDDGRGLDTEKLRKKALEKGIINDDTQLSQQETFNLIFEPGFSTAEKVSNISGRGVGMDVVKRNITNLRGRIDIDSELEKGTTIRIILPLTLAIIDGFLVGVGEESFVIPLGLVQECVELNEGQINHNGESSYINLRGNVLPLINLRRHFDLPPRTEKRQSVVVVRTGNHQGGLIVDRLMGEFQTVIKPLGQIFEHISGLGGSTILGSGKVALILDVQGLIASITATETSNI